MFGWVSLMSMHIAMVLEEDGILRVCTISLDEISGAQCDHGCRIIKCVVYSRIHGIYI